MEADFKNRSKRQGVRDEGADDLMRCDLHVHSWYSGPADLPVLKHIGRECYSNPWRSTNRRVGGAWTSSP